MIRFRLTKTVLRGLLPLFAMLLVGDAPSHREPPFPAPRTLGPVERYGRRIQRTMARLAESAPQRRNTVRILFYGQSITEQAWATLVAEDLRRRFPHANLVIENRAIGGHSSPRILRTMEADLFPFAPDLVIFHVYGDDGDYERIIRAIRARTTAEIMIQTDHLRRGDDPAKEETDPARIVRKGAMWDSWMNYVFLPRIAREYGAELVDQRELWKAYLRDHDLVPGQLLSDDVHLNDHGNYLMAEIVKTWLRFDPKLVADVDAGAVTTHRIGRDVKWKEGRLALPFDGNRIEAVLRPGPARAVAVRIDGKRPSEFPSLYAFTRTTHYPQSTWPTLLRVQAGAPLQLEDWTLTLTGLSADQKTVRFTLAGSKTGPDGEGVSTERFVSRSGRIVLEPGDWNLDYCLQAFKRPIAPGFRIEWRVVPLFADEIAAPGPADPAIETLLPLAQGLPNGPHTLELLGDPRAPIAAIRVHRPAKVGGERR